MWGSEDLQWAMAEDEVVDPALGGGRWRGWRGRAQACAPLGAVQNQALSPLATFGDGMCRRMVAYQHGLLDSRDDEVDDTQGLQLLGALLDHA